MFSMEDDIPALRQLLWGLVLATLLITVSFSARLYFSLGPAGESLEWLELTAMSTGLLALAVFSASVSSHLSQLKKQEEVAARQRRNERMAEYDRRERQ